jgi:signal transduction histidine kinase/ligand-binding sensor domain-containing protein
MLILFLIIIQIFSLTGISFSKNIYQPRHSDPLLELWRWQEFPELKGKGLRCIEEDHDGAIWFGTNQGVLKYDGLKWKHYEEKDGILGKSINVICCSWNNHIYIGTDKGISVIRDGVCSVIFPQDIDFFWPVHEIMEAEDRSIWAGTEWGLLYFRANKWLLITINSVASILEKVAPSIECYIIPDKTAPSRTWGFGIGMNTVSELVANLKPGGPAQKAGIYVGDRIIKVDGQYVGDHGWLNLPISTKVVLNVARKGYSKLLEFAVIPENIENHYNNFNVWDVFEDKNGYIWLGLFEGEIIRMNIYHLDSVKVISSKLFTEKDGLEITDKPKIYQRSNGEIITISDSQGGINRYNRNKWSTFRLISIGGNDSNTSILETSDGQLWIGGGKLHIYYNNNWKVYTSSDLPISFSRTIDLIENRDGNMWVAWKGQEAVLLNFSDKQWTTYEGLIYQCETKDHIKWFLDVENGVVKYDGNEWIKYTVEDGLIDEPVAIIIGDDSTVWVAGSHNNVAATAKFENEKWIREIHSRLSWGIDPRSVYKSADGELFFGGSTLIIPETEQIGGFLQYNNDKWNHHSWPGYTISIYGIGKTIDSSLWIGGWEGLFKFTEEGLKRITQPTEFRSTSVNRIYVDSKSYLWIGTRSYGLFQYTGKEWTCHNVQNGLANNNINHILEADDESIWVSTEKGISRYDGKIWLPHALPNSLNDALKGCRISLYQSNDGTIWINRFPWEWMRRSTPGSKYETPTNELQYSYRLNDGEWSDFIQETNQVFFSLSSGKYSIEVRARDRNMNIDQTPAKHDFIVMHPFWKQPWFIVLIIFFFSVIAVQTGRLIRRDKKLRRSNIDLQKARHGLEDKVNERTKELTEANEELRKQMNEREKAEKLVSIQQKKLIQADKMSSLGILVSGIAHEINNPNNFISLNNEIISKAWNDIISFFEKKIKKKDALTLASMPYPMAKEQIGQLIESNIKGSQRIKNIVNNLKDFARQDQANLNQKVDLNSVTESAIMIVKNLIEKSTGAFSTEYSEKHLFVKGDYQQIEQVIINLLTNACHALRDKNEAIVLKTYISKNKKNVILSLSDEGRGIPQKDLVHIIDPFFTTKRAIGGSGLGLSISYNIIQSHGGELLFESEEGSGTTAYIILPVNEI